MSKLANNKPFGKTMASKLSLGDLVSWSEWMIVDNDISEIVYYGTIVEKTTKIEGEREVCVINVACSKTGDVISLNPFQLRIEETN